MSKLVPGVTRQHRSHTRVVLVESQGSSHCDTALTLVSRAIAMNQGASNPWTLASPVHQQSQDTNIGHYQPQDTSKHVYSLVKGSNCNYCI